MLLAPTVASAAATIRVQASFDDEDQLRDKIEKSLRAIGGQQVSPEVWVVREMIASLKDVSSKMFDFRETIDAPDFDLKLKVHHSQSLQPWPSDKVLLEVALPSLPGKPCLQIPILDSLLKEKEKKTYADSWLAAHLIEEVQNGRLHQKILAHIPIKAQAKVVNDEAMATDIDWDLGDTKAVFAIAPPPATKLLFLQCENGRVGGPLLKATPASQPIDCIGDLKWSIAPKQWAAVYLTRIWSDR